MTRDWLGGFLKQIASRGRLLGRRGRKRGRPGVATAPGATLERFLDTPGAADKAAADRIEEEMNATGLPAMDLEQLRRRSLRVDPQALDVADDVLMGLRCCPAAEQSGVGAKELAGDVAALAALERLGPRLLWVEEQVRTGRQVLELWQRRFRATMAAELLRELAGARDVDQYLAIITDAAEVLEIEAGELAGLIAARKRNRDERGDLAGQVADEERDVRFLQTWQDLGQRQAVPPGVLETMAQYYARISEEDEPGRDK